MSDPGAEGRWETDCRFGASDLGLDEAEPDHSTISRFRGLLSPAGLDQRLFAEVVRQLDGKGLTIKASTLVDATLVPAAAAPPPPHQEAGGVVDRDALAQAGAGQDVVRL